MSRFIPFVLAACALSCRRPESEAIRAYTRFVDALAYGRFDEARSMADGQEVLDHIDALEAEFADAPKVKSTDLQISNSAKRSDTEFLLHGEQVVEFDPAQLPGNIAPTIGKQQVVGLRKVGDEWKITSFQERSGKIRPF